MFDIIGYWAVITLCTTLYLIPVIYVGYLLIVAGLNHITQEHLYGDKLETFIYSRMVIEGRTHYVLFDKIKFSTVYKSAPIAISLTIAGIAAMFLWILSVIAYVIDGYTPIFVMSATGTFMAPLIGTPIVIVSAYFLVLPLLRTAFNFYIRTKTFLDKMEKEK